jgi:hypothetical protein
MRSVAARYLDGVGAAALSTLNMLLSSQRITLVVWQCPKP